MNKTVFSSTCGSYSLDLFAREKANGDPVKLVTEKEYPLSGTVNMAWKVPRKIKKFDSENTELVFSDPKALTYFDPADVDASVKVYLHDLQVFYHHRNILDYGRKKLLQKHLKNADEIVAISDRVKINAKYVFDLNLEEISVEYQSVYPGRFSEPEPVDDLPEDFVLYVGGLGKRKNADLLERVAGELDKSLVVASKEEPDFKENIHFIRNPSDSKLSYLYSKAAVYLSVSDLEGFSRTPVEASSHGTPVVIHRFTPSKHLIPDELVFEFHDFSARAIAEKVEKASVNSIETFSSVSTEVVGE